jgi:hypothetical protein
MVTDSRSRSRSGRVTVTATVTGDSEYNHLLISKHSVKFEKGPALCTDIDSCKYKHNLLNTWELYTDIDSCKYIHNLGTLHRHRHCVVFESAYTLVLAFKKCMPVFQTLPLLLCVCIYVYLSVYVRMCVCVYVHV